MTEVATQPGEDPLLGGTANRGLVFRVGETVRRPLRATSASTHALLRHLADVGFDGAPRFLGIDVKGREVLSYIPGVAVTAPYPAWALTDTALASVAELLRAYHEAVSTFDPTSYRWTKAVPARFRTGIVSHNDPNLDNVVFRDQRAVALIDFDLASPGSEVWDVAAAARLWAPLRPDGDIADARRGRALARLRGFADAYRLGDTDRELLPAAVLDNHDWCYDVVRQGAEGGHAGFTAYWLDAAARARRTRRWYLGNMDLLRAALRR
jgi:Ser/Thr protein kinase RdoA (MazF antagonist)